MKGDPVVIPHGNCKRITIGEAGCIWQELEWLGLMGVKREKWLREVYGLGILRGNKKPVGPVIIAVYVN